MKFHNLSTFLILSLVFVNLVSSFEDETDESCDVIKGRCKFIVNNATEEYPNYAGFRTPDLIRFFGYPVEEHNITTDDGYILTVYRIPYSDKSPNSTAEKIPVFCMHGLVASSAQWFWQPANRALVFMLADAGYDVWIGNARGTTYSQNHVSLPVNDPNNLTYWDFSSYEMGKYDVPAYISYITETSGQPSLYYIGHSLGGCQFFIAMTLYPELQSKIRTMFALAPAVYTGNTTNAFLRTAAVSYSSYTVEVIENRIGKGRYTHSALGSIIGEVTRHCPNSAINCGLCANGFFLLMGVNPCQTNFTTLPGVLAHLPDIVSAKTFSHSSQAIQTGQFRQYDYGLENIDRYGTVNPPDYDWSVLNVPVVLYSGQNDNLVTPKDLRKLGVKLGSNMKEFISVPYRDWTHMDFVLAIDADKYVYNHIMDIMNNRTYDSNCN